MKNIYFLSMILISILNFSSCYDWFLEIKMKNLLSEFMNCYNYQDMEKISFLFHNPMDLNKEQIAINEDEFRNKIEILRSRLGIISFTKSVPDSDFCEIELFKGNKQDFYDFPFSKAGIFQVKFESVGYGWLEIQIYETDIGFLIRKIAIEIPKSQSTQFDGLYL